MPVWMQHIFVLSLTVACLFVVVRGGIRSLRGKNGIGNCCAKGCGHATKPQGERIVFLPVEMLRRK